MRVLVLLLFAISIVDCTCPDGLELVENGECRYFYGTMSIPYDQSTPTAISKCQEMNAQPVIIHNEAQQSHWIDEKNSKGNLLALGVVCNTITTKWQWADGSAIDYKPPYYDTSLNSACSTTWSWYIMNSTGYWNGTPSTDTNMFDVFCTLQNHQPIPSGDGCEEFEDDSENGVCYQIASAAQDWKEAQMICGSFGAAVAPVHNLQENSFLRRLAVSQGIFNGLYLGATMTGKGNQFGWIDGSDWNYANFFPGFPMAGLGDCLVMDTEGTSGQWANVDCSAKLSVACKRSHDYKSPSCSTGPWTEGQIIFSPGFPFDASTPCDYLLSVEAGKRIEIEVILLEANSCCDHLTIFDNYFGGNLIANLTSSVEKKIYTSDYSNFMRVSWQPNGGVNVRGMMISFRGV